MRLQPPGLCRSMLTHVVKVGAKGMQAGHQPHSLPWTIASPQCSTVSITQDRTYEHMVNFSEYWLSYCCVPPSLWADFCLTNRLSCSPMLCSNLTWCEVWLCQSFTCSFPTSWFVCLCSYWPMGKTVRNLSSLCI